MDKTGERPPEPKADDVIVPVIQDEVIARAQRVKTGSVRVDKHVEKNVRKIAVPLVHDDVEVRRVAVNRVIKEIPTVRSQDGIVVVPVVEEELVITKRLILKEEIHLIRRRTRERTIKEVEVQKEHAEVRRLDSDGRVIDPEPENPITARGRRRRSVLD